MSGCDRCGLEPFECNCLLYELAKRVTEIEEVLEELQDALLELQKVKDE